MKQTKSVLELLKTLDELNKTLESLSVETEKSRIVPQKAKISREFIERVAEPLPEEYVSCKYSDLLKEIKYYPLGNAPSEDNIFYDEHSKNNFWYCSNKPVAFRSVDCDGEIVTISSNAFDRYTTSVSKRWAMERDWIPSYRYSLEDNKQDVGLVVLDSLRKDIDLTKITKLCFDKLDGRFQDRPSDYFEEFKDEEAKDREEKYIYHTKSGKTLQIGENCNDAERYIYAMLFTGDVNTLHKLIGINGQEVDLPTKESLEQLTEYELEKFRTIYKLFKRVKERHKGASKEGWVCAQSYALRVPTKTAIEMIYGEKAKGKKKYRRCEVAYSRMALQIFKWLLEEVEIMLDESDIYSWGFKQEGLLKGLGKWVEVLKRDKAMAYANTLLSSVLKHEIIVDTIKSQKENNGSSQIETIVDGIKTLIVANPCKAIDILEGFIKDAELDLDIDILKELREEYVFYNA